MATLIDGYNLLNATEVFCDAVGPGSVEKLHGALMDKLVELLEPREVSRTTIVFDARGRRARARRVRQYRAVTVHYSACSETADDLLEELIQSSASPRQLVVVSSDHQVQRAARRRRATAVDSHIWFQKLLARQRARQRPPSDPKIEPAEAIVYPPEIIAQAKSQLRDQSPFPEDYLAEMRRELRGEDGGGRSTDAC